MAAIVAWTAAFPAAAQRTGSLLGHNATKKDAVSTVHLVAECYYDRSPKHVGEWLQLLPGDKAERRLIDRDTIDLSACLDGDRVVFDGKELVFNTSTFRESVGAVAARRTLLQGGAPNAPAAGTKPWFYSLLAERSTTAPVDSVALAVQEFGYCVALTHWADSLALIGSKDNSAEESAAVSALAPGLGGCVAKGSTIKITRRDLRNMIGEPVYHLLLLTAPSGQRR